MQTELEQLKEAVSRLLTAAEEADSAFAGRPLSDKFTLIAIKQNYEPIQREIQKLRVLVGEE